MPSVEPEQDPTYLAFQRALGFDDNDLRSVVAQRKLALARRWQYMLPQLTAQHTSNERGIDNNYLSRGASTSGHRAMDQGDELARHALAIGAGQNDYATGLTDLDADLARSLATNQRKLAEEGLAARSRLAMDVAAATPTTAPAPLAAAVAQAAPLAAPAAPAPPVVRTTAKVAAKAKAKAAPTTYGMMQ